MRGLITLAAVALPVSIGLDIVRVWSKGASCAKSQLQLTGHKKLSGIWDVRAGGGRMGIGRRVL